MSSKDTNPKDALGSAKAGTTLVPASLPLFASMSFTEGATKYGAFNWRHAGVRATVYVDALRRHLEKWVAGEECDPDTKVPHLASVIACAGIILDAQLHNMLKDDRPDSSPVLHELMAKVADVQGHLKRLHADKNPVHYLKDRAAQPLLDVVERRERHLRGISDAVKAGKYLGRKPALNAEQVQALRLADTQSGGKNRKALAARYGISRNSLYRYLSEEVTNA